LYRTVQYSTGNCTVIITTLRHMTLFLCSKLHVYVGWHWVHIGRLPRGRIFLCVSLNIETMSRGLWIWPSLCRHRLASCRTPVVLLDINKS